jgi:hypothetical protein
MSKRDVANLGLRAWRATQELQEPGVLTASRKIVNQHPNDLVDALTNTGREAGGKS